MKRAVGISILAAVVVGLFAMTARDMGLLHAALLWAFATVFAGIVGVGIILATSDD